MNNLTKFWWENEVWWLYVTMHGPDVTPFIYMLMYVQEKELVKNYLKSHIHAHVQRKLSRTTLLFSHIGMCVCEWDLR